jgi:hypothetical protein
MEIYVNITAATWVRSIVKFVDTVTLGMELRRTILLEMTFKTVWKMQAFVTGTRTGKWVQDKGLVSQDDIFLGTTN